MQTKIIATTEEFYKLKDDWERLQEQDTDTTYYSTFEYNWTWWDVYHQDNDKKLFIICVYNNDKIVGIAPLIIETKPKKVFKYNVLKFMGAGDYLNVLVDKKEKNELTIIKDIFNEIEKMNEKYERIQLTHIKHNSMFASYLLKSKIYNANFKYLIECPILRIRNFEDYDDYKKKFITSSANKYKNRLKREVDYDFFVINNKSIDVYERISDLHIKEQEFLTNERNRQDRYSLFNDKLRGDFTRKIYKNNSNVITFLLETKNKELIIYDTCYSYKGILHSWNMAFNPIYEKYNVGRIINYEIFKYIFENNFAYVFDFGAGRYPWKFEWTNDFIFDYQLDMWNEKTKKGRLLKKIYKIKERVK